MIDELLDRVPHFNLRFVQAAHKHIKHIDSLIEEYRIAGVPE